jgi:hypothetical protein
VILLGEDRRHLRFLTGLLRKLSYTNHQIRELPLPAAKGSGEQWVRKKYASEVTDFRTRSGGAATVLIVVIDADTGTVQRREQQFRDKLVAEGVRPLDPNELVVHLIPRRNLETWVTFLNGTPVTEEADYKPSVTDEQVRPAADKFYQFTRPNVVLGPHTPPSLQHGVREAGRIPSR